MDKDLKALFQILQKKGVFKTEESMMAVIEAEGIEVLFPVMPEGMFNSVESFASAFPGAVKKKDYSGPISQEEDTVSTTPVEQEEPISSESSRVVEDPGEVTQYEAGRRHRGQESVRVEEEREREELNRRAYLEGERGEVTLPTGEKDTAIERTFGKNEVTDFFGDIWRAGAKGVETGNTVDEALEIMWKGKEASSQDIQDYLNASESLAERGESDEMRSFNKAFKDAGGGAWGFLRGMWDSPTAISEIAITSITQMLNPASAAAAGAVVGTGAAGGAGVGAFAGGVGAAPGALVGALASIPYAIGAAGATLEAGLSFSEFLQEEVSAMGLELDEDGVRAVFADPDAMLRIRMKAAGRGVVIGIIDGLTAGVAGKIGSGITKGGVGVSKSLAKDKLKALAAGTVIEGAGGGLGEATARAVVGQEMDALEIGFEIVGGGPGSILSVAPALVGKGKYAFGPDGAPMTREQMIKMVTETDDVTFAGSKLNIKGDPGLKLLAEERKNKLRKQAGIIESLGTELDGLSSEGKQKAIEMETELSEMGSPMTRKGKNTKKVLQDELDALYENDPGVTEDVEVTEDVVTAEDGVTEESSDFEVLMDGQVDVEAEVEADVEVDADVITEEADANPRKDKAPVYKKGGKKLLFTGSPRKFTTFDMSKVGSNADAGSPKGIFFSNDPGVAGFYANEVNGDGMGQLLNMVGLGKLKGIEPTIYSAVLNTENIKEVEFNGESSSSAMDKNAIIQEAFAEGFDAVVLKNIKDGPSVPQDVTVVKDSKFIDQFTDTKDGSGRKLSRNLSKQKQDAIQESSTKEVDVQKQAEDGQPVGKRDATGRATVKGEVETEVSPEATQKKIEAQQDLVDELQEDSREAQAVWESTADPREIINNQKKGIVDPGTAKINEELTKAEEKLKELKGKAEVGTRTQEIELTAGFTKEGVEIKAPKRKGRKVNDSLTVLDQTEEDSHYGSEDFKKNNPGSNKNKHEKMLLGRAEKAVKSIQKIFPGLNIVMHRSEGTYKDHVGVSSRGAYNSSTNAIHINMPKAQGRTIGHEVFHAVLKAKFGDSVSIQRATKLMIKSLRRGINKSTNLSKKQVLELEKYSQLFKGDKEFLQNEEFIVEFVGVLSETYTKLEVPQQTVIKKWVSKVAKMLGLPTEDVLADSDRDVVDLLNTIAGKVTEGKEIAEADLKSLDKLKDKKKPATKTQAVTEVEGGQKVSNPADALKTQAIGAFEVSYTQQEKVAQMIKEGFITEPDDISFLKGKDTVITSPDDMLVGEISLNGKPIFEGGGGVFAVTKHGDVWMSAKKGPAENIARGINRGLKENGGKGYLTLTKGTDKKLVSSAAGVNSTLAILDSMLDEGLVSPSNFRAAVSSAVKKFGGEIDLRGSSKKLKADVNEYFSDPSTTTFEKRGNIVESIVGEIANSLSKELRPKVVQFLGGDPNKSVGVGNTPKSQSLVDLVAGVAAEKLTKGLKTGDVYAVIEVDGEVEVVKGDHKSYPWHVKLKDGGKPILHLPKNREAGGKVLVHKSGKPYAVGQATVVSGTFQGQTEGIKTQAILENDPTNPYHNLIRAKVNDLKRVDKKSDDGVTLNVDGTQYTGGGLVVPAATKNTTQSELSPGMVERFVKDNDGKIGTDGIVKVGLYKFPKSDQVSIDLNIVVPAKNEKIALEFGRLAGQESLFSLDTFENIKTGATGANPISFTDAQFLQIAKDLKANKVPKVFDGDIKTQAMTAPNGKPSNLTPEQHDLVRTPAFKKWFGDWETDPKNASKVVDENGEPLVVYHGTDTNFSEFFEGSFFTDDYFNADGYAGGEIVYEVFLSIKNPLVIDGKGKKWDNLAAPYLSTQNVVGGLDTKKHDGVVFNNIKDSWMDDVDYQDPGTVYSIQVSNQAKLADGTNKTFSPDSDSIKTQVFNPTNTTEDIIKFGRENNFSDAMIKDYLVRVKKEKVKEVNRMMAIDVDMFRQMPVSFGNIEGGAKVGAKLFARVEKFMEKLNAKNNKRKEDDRLSEREIMDQTIEFLEKQPAYIAEGGKRKAETDQQTQMIIEMQKALGVNPTKGMNTRIREMRQKMVERRRGGMDLQAVKRDLRNFIRQALPTVKGSTYSKSELMTLLGKVAKADKKNIANLMDEVVDIVTKRQVKALDAKIESILNGKYEVVQSGRLKGVKIDVETRQRLEAIQAAVTDEAMTAEGVVAANLTLNEEFNALNEKADQTDADRNKMVDLMTIMSINNSKLMEDVDIDKLESLSTAEELLLGIVGEGKQTLKDQMRVDHDRYTSHLVRVYKTVTGETIDPSNPDVMQDAKEALMDQKNRKESRAAEKGLKKYLRKIIEKVSSFKKSSESVEGLMEIIAEAPGEILGGDARKIVYEGLNAGTRVYKKRMMEATKVIQDKVKEIYGKGWRKQSRENSVRKNTGVYRTGGKEAIARAQAKYDAKPTKLNKRNLAKVQASKLINLSPNEIAQQWQQYQDPANLPSFANEENLYFGEDHARIMAELVESIGGEDGKILEMAKWQVEEFYPSMYPHLNEAYKKIYRTNMPWNAHYAGRIKREGVESQGLDLLGRKESFNTQVGAASTKVRIKNSKPIQPMDMMGAMVTYTTDMEWFGAMGPTIRDIDKLFSNPLMREAIENVAGESTMRLIDHHMKNIAARGVNTERGQDMVNTMNNMFATTRLGFSPNIAIKQLTSIPTYALDIGVGNYAYHAVKNKTEFLKVFNEIRNNSVYLQDRVSSDIRQVTESYSGKQDIDFVPKSASSWFTNTMMGFIKAGDITAIYLGGMPNYSFYKAEYMKANPNATEQQAIDHAVVKFESDTKSTQQSMDLQDKDFYQTSGAFARSLNLFKTSQKQYLRKEFSGLRNMRRGFRDKNWGQAGKGAVKFATFHAMMPVLFQFIASGLPGLMSDWDEEDGEDILRAAVIGNLNALFIVGDIIKGASDAIAQKPWADRVGTIPAYEFFGEIFGEYGKYATLKDPEKKQEAFMKMMTRIGELVTLGKIPMYNLRRMFMNLEKAGEAKDEREVALRLLNYSDYAIEGPKSGSKKTTKRKTTKEKENDTGYDRDRGEGYRN